MDTEALRDIEYGVYVIGSKKDDGADASIVNTVFQITSNPLTIAVAITKSNLTISTKSGFLFMNDSKYGSRFNFHFHILAPLNS